MSKTLTIVVVILVILGGWYLWSRGGESDLAPATGGSSSDSLSSIEADLQNLEVEDIGTDIDPL